MAEQYPHNSPSAPTTEEAVRQWWQQRFGTPLPEDVKTYLRGLLRQEIARTRLEANRLDDVALQRVREGRRLLQTKLSNVEATLQQIRLQRERTQQYLGMCSELELLRQRLYEIGKQQASVLTQQRELERFETFEAINGRFQRIHTLSEGISLARKDISRLALQIDEAKKKDAEAAKGIEAEREKTQDAIDTLIQAALTMAETERLTEQMATLQSWQKEAKSIAMTYRERLSILQGKLAESKSEEERLQDELAALKLQSQTLEAHRQMIAKSEALQVMLDELQKAKDLQETLSTELNQTLRWKNERDEQLGRLFTEHQKLIAAIKALQEEADAHRSNIAGQDSFHLQRKVLELHNRKLMLETGLSLWKNIATGYDQLELKEQQITVIRLSTDQLNTTVDALETELRKLESQLQQKTYHWTLSKSQNVIELRSDLQEGKACTVCGATHHPWLGKDIKEQSALISALKADCEQLEEEVRSKKGQLDETRQKLTANIAKLEVETANIQLLQARLKQDTGEWQNFASLDRSFIECSRSTNREARSILMRQLIERTATDSEEAEKELNAFTFHLNAISRLGTSIQEKQQESDELTVRLNEVNTACQVLAWQVERLNQHQAAATRDYSQRYETLVREITIPNWFQRWKVAPESVKLRILETSRTWTDIQSDITFHEKEIQKFHTKNEMLQKAIAELQSDIPKAETRYAKTEEQSSKAANELHKALPDSDGKTLFQNAQHTLQNKQESLQKAETAYKEQLLQYLTLTTQQKNLEDLVHQDEERVAEERKVLDIWMRQYNANHPPVQFAELERVLADGKDWTEIRKNTREIAIESATTQAKADHLRAQIIALQAEGIRPNIENGDEEQKKLCLQQEEVEQQRRDILRQTAHLDEQLRAHEQAITSIEEADK